MKNKLKFAAILLAAALILGFCVYQASQAYLKKLIAEKGPVAAYVQTVD